MTRADEGGLEERQVNAQFEVPMNGTTYGWHMDGGPPQVVRAATFEFQGPDIELMLRDAENIARGKQIQELAKMSIGEVALILAAVKETGWVSD